MKQISPKANQKNHFISKLLSQWYRHMLSETVIKSRATIAYNEEKSTLLNLIIGSTALKKIYICCLSYRTFLSQRPFIVTNHQLIRLHWQDTLFFPQKTTFMMSFLFCVLQRRTGWDCSFPASKAKGKGFETDPKILELVVIVMLSKRKDFSSGIPRNLVFCFQEYYRILWRTDKSQWKLGDPCENSNLTSIQFEAYVYVIKDKIQQCLCSFYCFHPNK